MHFSRTFSLLLFCFINRRTVGVRSWFACSAFLVISLQLGTHGMCRAWAIGCYLSFRSMMPQLGTLDLYFIPLLHNHSATPSHCCFFKLRWSSGSTKTTRSRSFLSTSSLCVSYASVMLDNLSSVSLSIIDCASCVDPACCRDVLSN